MIKLTRSTEKELQYEQGYRSLYDKPKSLFRTIIQNIFLKTLLLLFPKKFPKIKKKIKFIMDVAGRRTFVFFIGFKLRFKNPRYFRLPSSQIYALHIYTKLLKILENKKIDFFLVGGCLLGAIRQESFAGNPGDIDLGIKENQLSNLLNAFPLLIENGAILIRTSPYNKDPYDKDKVERLQIFFPRMSVDVGIYRKVIVKEKEMWGNFGGETENQHFPQNQNLSTERFTISLDYLKPINAYGMKFLSPPNPEIYLERKYGKNWRSPNKKQFFWRKQ